MLLGRLPRAVVRPPLVKLGRAEIDAHPRWRWSRPDLLDPEGQARRGVTADCRGLIAPPFCGHCGRPWNPLDDQCPGTRPAPQDQLAERQYGPERRDPDRRRGVRRRLCRRLGGGDHHRDLVGIRPRDRIIGIVHWIVSFFGVEFEVTTWHGVLLLRLILFAVGIAVMISFIRQARRVEPFTSRQ